MRQYQWVLGTAAVAALAVSGCVSTGKYEKLEADKNQEIATLQKDKANLQSQLAGVEQEKAALVTSSQQAQAERDALVKKLSAEVEKGELQVKQYQNMLSVSVAEQIFFDSGKAELKPGGKDILTKVGEALKSYNDKIIRVVGYTDNVPVAKTMQKVYPSNWELSVARATNVVRYLQEVGVPPERMVAAGRGEYAPVADNETPEGRQKNRRIEIMLIDQNLAEEMAKPK